MAPLSGAETTSTLNGLYKEVYGEDGPKDLIPQALRVQSLIPFVPKSQELGNQYHQPVLLAYPGGFTQAGPNSGAFALNGAVAMTTKDAVIDGSQVLLQEYMDYESAARSGKSKNSFVDGTTLLFEAMQKSHRKRNEILYMYGQSGLGVISSVSVSGNATVVFTAASWAPGIWAGTTGHKYDAYATSTHINTNAALVVVSVDIDTRTVVFSGNATDLAALAANQDIYFYGSFGNEMLGIKKVLSTTSGNLFGISTAFDLWKGTQYAAGGAQLSFGKIKGAVAKAVGRGLDEDVDVLVNPKGWDDMMTDLAALRRFVEKEGKGMAYEIGAEKIVFYSQAGKMSIIPHICIKEGDAFGLLTSSWKRIGATDVTFNTPSHGGEIFQQVPGYAAFEVRSYSHTAILCDMPARNFLITGIVNS